MTILRTRPPALSLVAGSTGRPMRRAAGELARIRIAQPFGLGYLPLVVMRHERLVERRAEGLGIAGLRVDWGRVGHGAAGVDLVLDGRVELAAGGMATVLAGWDRGRGDPAIRGVGALDASPLPLNTASPRIASLHDVAGSDRIAVPARRFSQQAVLLRMAVEQTFGHGAYARLDHLTVAMSHPEATLALIARRGVTLHFAAAPYGDLERAAAGVRRILSSDDVAGGPMTMTALFATDRFRDANPTVQRAVFLALRDAHVLIANDPERAARIYLAAEADGTDPGLAQRVVAGARHSIVPQGTLGLARFMKRTGTLDGDAGSWRDFFFPELHDEPGG